MVGVKPTTILNTWINQQKSKDMAWIKCKKCGHYFDLDMNDSLCPKCNQNQYKDIEPDLTKSQVLEYYLPSAILCKTPTGIGKLTGMTALGQFQFAINPGLIVFAAERVTPFLRPLADKTQDEESAARRLETGEDTLYRIKYGYYKPHVLMLHIKYGFDVLGAINKGLAEERTIEEMETDYPDFFNKSTI